VNGHHVKWGIDRFHARENTAGRERGPPVSC
jgi:hypothetical protein